MNQNEVRRAFEGWRQANSRPSWKPITEDRDGTILDSKFSGRPWLADGELWPACPGCRRSMQLFLQLNLSQLPAELNGRFGTGWLQLFYCVTEDCEAMMDNWEPFSQGKLVRVVQPLHGEGENVAAPEEHFTPRTIVSWERHDDFPDDSDHEDLGLKYRCRRNTVDVRWQDGGVELKGLHYDEIAKLSNALPGDKLAGWSAWSQGNELPRCPECDELMEFVFQIDSNDHLPFMFGDLGRGHVTQCPIHREVVAFG